MLPSHSNAQVIGQVLQTSTKYSLASYCTFLNFIAHGFLILHTHHHDNIGEVDLSIRRGFNRTQLIHCICKPRQPALLKLRSLGLRLFANTQQHHAGIMSSGDTPEAATKTSTQSQQLSSRRRYTLDQFSDDIEFIGNYCVGGYHPVHIHDRLHDRYEVIHKLGHGSYSTIWLARDHMIEQNVAIKILIADNDRPIGSKILSILNKASSNSEMATLTQTRELQH